MQNRIQFLRRVFGREAENIDSSPGYSSRSAAARSF
jgi:hypothetical protein